MVELVQAAILVVMEPAPEDVMVAALGDFRAAKVSRGCGATYPDEVRLEGPDLDDRNSVACGVRWAAERLAIAYLAASAQGECSAA